MAYNRRLKRLLALDTPQRMAELAKLSQVEQLEFRYHWRLWARDEQVAPAGDWRTWLVMAGRGFGKTRAGADWVREIASRDPAARIALVGASLAEVRSVMVEGESGLLETAPPDRRPTFEPSLRRLTWRNGAQATIFSAGEPEALRGPQHSHAWCAGPEGIFRQRSRIAHRRVTPLRDRGDRDRPARGTVAGRDLAGRHRAERRLDRTGRANRQFPGGQLDVPSAARWNSGAVAPDRAALRLSRGLAQSRAPG